MRASDKSSAAPTENTGKVLVLEAGGIGDAVMATPALAAIRRRWPNAHISVVVAPRAAEIIRPLDLAFEIRTLRLGQALGQLTDAARLILNARLNRPDVLIDLSSIESARAARKRRWLVGLIGARLNIGRNTDGRGTFFDAAMSESLFGEEHEVERKAKALASLDIRVEKPAPFLRIPREALESARLLLQEAGIDRDSEMIGINPGAFLPTRRWPVENFERLASTLTEDGDRCLLVTGGEPERDLVKRVAKAAHGRRLRAVAQPLMEAAALIKRCRIFITNDTGMMHVAAALNVPVLALFGRSNAQRYRPYLPADRYILLQQPAEVCEEYEPDFKLPECRRMSCRSGACMTSMDFSSVLDAARQLLESG